MERLLSNFGVQQIVLTHGLVEMVTQSSSHKIKLQIVAINLLSVASKTACDAAPDHFAKPNCTQIIGQIDKPYASFLYAAMNLGQHFDIFDKACSAPSSNFSNKPL